MFDALYLAAASVAREKAQIAEKQALDEVDATYDAKNRTSVHAVSAEVKQEEQTRLELAKKDAVAQIEMKRHQRIEKEQQKVDQWKNKHIQQNTTELTKEATIAQRKA